MRNKTGVTQVAELHKSCLNVSLCFPCELNAPIFGKCLQVCVDWVNCLTPMPCLTQAATVHCQETHCSSLLQSFTSFSSVTVSVLLTSHTLVI